MGKGERGWPEPEHNLEGAVNPKKSSYQFSKSIVSIFAKKVEHPSGPDTLNAFIIPFVWIYFSTSVLKMENSNNRQLINSLKQLNPMSIAENVL